MQENWSSLRARDLDESAADADGAEDADEDEPEPEDEVDLVDDDVQRQDAHGVQPCTEVFSWLVAQGLAPQRYSHGWFVQGCGKAFVV